MDSEKQRKTFLSYSRANKDFALALAKELKAEGFDVWLDQLDIPLGARWDREVEKALKESEIFMIILTTASVDSENVLDEIGYAIDTHKRFLPVLLEECEVPLRLRRFQYVDFTNKSFDEGVEAAKGLLRGLIAQPTIPRRETVSSAQAAEADPKAQVKAAPVSTMPAQKRPAPKGLMYGIAAIVVFAIVGVGLSALSYSKNKNTPISTQTANAVIVVPATKAPVTLTITTVAPANTATITPTPIPTQGIVNTMISEKDGMPLVYVPAGKFTMGSNSGSEYDGKPMHIVYLDAFWIDQTEVTVRMYSMCVQAGKCEEPTRKDSATHTSYYGNAEFDNYPVIFMTWYKADDYCKWADRRLPTEAEWEKAARGENAFIYPWGNVTPNNSLLNYNDAVGDTTEVGKYPAGASPYGALDMAGNIWEWVNDWYSDTYDASQYLTLNPVGPDSGEFKLLRSGSWYYPEVNIRTASRSFKFSPNTVSPGIGFRCAVSGTP